MFRPQFVYLSGFAYLITLVDHPTLPDFIGGEGWPPA